MSFHKNSRDGDRPFRRLHKPSDPAEVPPPSVPMPPIDGLTMDQFIRAYRGVMAQLKSQTDARTRAEFQAIAMRLREGWMAQHGEDNLHAMAFGQAQE